MIRLADVAVTHPGEGEPTIDGIDLLVRPGEVVVLTGPSGSGKTTLTRVVNGLIPTLHPGRVSGLVEVGGADPARQPLHATSRIVGSVFQNPRTQFFATEVLDELAFAAENAGLPRARIAALVSETLARFDLEPLAGRSVFELSGGQKQILACASVDVLRPPVLVLDEPSANLDDRATRHVAGIIATWKSGGRAVLIAEHRLGWLLDVADRIVVMDSGRIAATLSPAEFRALDEPSRRRWGLRDPDPGAVDDLRYATGPSTQPLGALVIQDAEVRYRRGGGAAVRIARTELPTGHIVAITGPNGAGKSSLARFLVGLRGTGRIERDGARLSARRRRSRSALVMQDVGHQLFADTVRSELELARRRPDPDEVGEVLAALGLTELAERHPLALSAGQQQRLAVAAAICGDRRVIVLDEPTSGLDRAGMERVATTMRLLRDRGKDVYLTTHDREFAELVATRRLHLRPGLEPITHEETR